ncbi:Fe-S cluster assembly ATPase SufC [Clostridioides mangenotii]|uniref:Fe-S cluster assembly ATPase SufC n=1 Tax=Metaclostridioides mangenotii TaxID=1540 RepID=UPI001C100BC9|nr:Fe-S cluster assembly ATPase SufC [Clostridioides mangenotii]MBU5308540.1 Fe-S cluster assembly ATPase SufC [Clostridioides mangenotii]
MNNRLLDIDDVYASIEGKCILNGLNIQVNKGEIHVIMGPNGAGKSTLANVLMGHPKYKLDSGNIIFEGESIAELKVNERAKKGLFLSFQNPEEVNGVTVENFLRAAVTSQRDKAPKVIAFNKAITKQMEELKMNQELSKRYLNVGFSGGEKKKNEILQLLTLQPKLAILDETDSGLDVDAMKIVSNGVNLYANSDNAVIIITHNKRILENIKVDYVHVLKEGRIVASGPKSLVNEIENNGYGAFSESSDVCK